MDTFITLPSRGLLKIAGADRRKFLQGLITNDINLLDTQDSLYACLLTHHGRFLHDFIIYEHNDIIHIDCEPGPRAQDLLTRLQRFKLRADIHFELKDNTIVYALMDPPEVLRPALDAGPTGHNHTLNALSLDPASSAGRSIEKSYKDPRHPDLGLRTLQKPANLPESPFDLWDQTRIRLTVPDGSRDMVPEKSLLLEHNIDNLHGISWTKGCYIGQELTARTNYRALVKKQLVTVEFDTAPPLPFTELSDNNGNKIGEMRSSNGPTGLALLKKEALSGPLEILNLKLR